MYMHIACKNEVAKPQSFLSKIANILQEICRKISDLPFGKKEFQLKDN